MSETNAEPLLLSMAEAAAMLRLGERTVWSLANRGALPSLKVGARTLFDPSALRAWVRAGAPTDPGAADRIEGVEL
ncbi:MAG: helix-turn-helix domain-containing protein [Planctomycetota bacterium]